MSVFSLHDFRFLHKVGLMRNQLWTVSYHFRHLGIWAKTFGARWAVNVCTISASWQSRVCVSRRWETLVLWEVMGTSCFYFSFVSLLIYQPRAAVRCSLSFAGLFLEVLLIAIILLPSAPCSFRMCASVFSRVLPLVLVRPHLWLVIMVRYSLCLFLPLPLDNFISLL